MPTPKAKRDIVLQSTFSAANVATLSLGVDASFTTNRGVDTANIFEDSSAGTSNEATEYQMSFTNGSNAPVGQITLSFFGRGDNQTRGLVVNKTSAVSSIDPTPRTATVTPISNPDASYSRTWQQAALNGTSTMVTQVGGVDVRVKANGGYSVIQTVTSTAIGQLVLSYAFKTATGADVATGTVTLTASSVAGTGYSLGTASVTDSNPRSSSTRR